MMYFIKTDDGWKIVSQEVYQEFDGEKESRTVDWFYERLMDMMDQELEIKLNGGAHDD